jgi:hypothetical protein
VKTEEDRLDTNETLFTPKKMGEFTFGISPTPSKEMFSVEYLKSETRTLRDANEFNLMSIAELYDGNLMKIKVHEDDKIDISQ